MLILGAGISGLTLAWSLRKQGIHCQVIDPARRVGGVIRTDRGVSGCIFESGPSSLQIKSRRVETLIHEAGLASKIVEANPAARKRFVIQGGAPIALPGSLLGAVTTPLYSFKDKLRLLREPFIAPTSKSDESLESFATRRLGKAFADYGVSVLASGIYAGDPTKLSIRHGFPKVWNLEKAHGSLIRGALKLKMEAKKSERYRPRLVSFENGLETLPEELAKSLEEQVMTGTTPLSIQRLNNRWKVRWEGPDGPGGGTFNKLVVTAPLHLWPGLPVDDFVRDQFNSLPQVSYSPLTVLGVAYPRTAVGHPLDGFGLLAPLKEKRRILGALFASQLFPGRAPTDLATFTVFVGGATMPKLSTLPDYALHELLHHELSALFGITELPQLIRRYDWPKAIPQYNVGYDFFLGALARVEHALPGFHALGNFRGGPGISDCIESALSLAERIAAESDSA